MSQRHTYAEIASDWSLWVQYVDPDATMTREEFDSMPMERRIALQVDAFGPEQQPLRTWSVRSTAGVDMGEYIADSEQGAIDACCRDAGYEGEADCIAQGIGSHGDLVATLVPTDEWRVTIDHDGAGVVHADSAEQALDLACAMVQRGDYSGDEPVWVDVYVDRGSERAERTVQLDPEPPECQDALGHDWEDVAALGHGGGVIVRERCSHCGVIRVTDTWAQRPDNGVQGYTTVQYESPSDDDLDD